MSWGMRYLCNYVGGLLAAIALVLVFCFVLGAPGVPIVVPRAHLALVVIIGWAFLQTYVSLLGLPADAVLSGIRWRQPPTAKMAFWHGVLASSVLLFLAYVNRHEGVWPSLVMRGFVIPMGVQAGIRLIAGRPFERA